MALLSRKALSGLTTSRCCRPTPISPVLRTPGRAASVVVRVQQEDIKTDAQLAGDDPSAQLQESLSKVVKTAQEKWEETPGEERPFAIAIIISAVIAQIVIGATVDAMDRLPIVNQFLELVGLAVVSVYGYRYFTDPFERETLKKNVDAFVAEVTGKK